MVLIKKVGRCIILSNFMIKKKFPESFNEILDSYFFNLRKCLFRTFPDSHFQNHTKEKSKRWNFVNMNLVQYFY